MSEKNWDEMQDEINEILDGEVGVQWRINQIGDQQSNDDPGGCVHHAEEAVALLLRLKRLIESRRP